MVKVCAPKSQNASQFVAGFDGSFAPGAYIRSMPRKPIELPPVVARAFVKNMRAFLAEENTIKRDEIAARHPRPDELRLSGLDEGIEPLPRIPDA
jgi:hypothetical protein